MPTVIDALVVTLGLDAKQFNEEQKKAVRYLSELEESTRKHGGGATRQVNEMVGAFKELQGRLLAVGAIIAAGLGFNRLTQDITKSANELGLLSTQLKMTAQDLDAWEKVGRTVGLAAGEMTQGLASVNAQLQEFHATGTSQLQALMGRDKASGGLGIKPMQPNDTAASVMMRLSEWYAGQSDKAFASHLLQTRGGLSRGTISALALGPEELQKRLDQAKRIAPTDDEINKFKELTKAFGDMMNVIERLTQLALKPFIETMTKILNMLTEWLTAFATGQKNQAAAKAAAEATSVTPGAAPPAQSTVSPMRRLRNWFRGRVGLPTDDAAGAEGGGGGAPGSGSAPGAAPGGAQPTAPGAVSPGGSDFLRRERQGFADQLSDPGVRQRVAGMALLEDARNPTSAVESLANRFGYVNSERAKRGLPPVTVDQMLNGGFYGPINRGGLPGAVNQLNSEPGTALKMNRAIDNVIGGSNTIQGFTDQGLPSDPNGWRQPQLSLGTGNIFNDWNGGGRLGAGDYRNAAAYREYLMRGVAAERAGAGAGAVRGTPGLTGAGRTFDNWRSLGFGRGAALRGGDTTNNNNSSTTTIGSMHVTVPPGADPSAYADGISRRLGDYNNVANANTGLV